MAQLIRTATHNPRKQPPSLTIFCIEVFASALLCAVLVSGIYFALEATLGNNLASPVVHAALQEQPVHVNLSIVLNQSGYQKDWPAYAPNVLVVPANKLVTVTIRNYDLGDNTLPPGSPFTAVQGIVGNVAHANGHTYPALAATKIAHTFTIAQLHINVPVPGDTTTGKPYSQVSFTFHTGAPGSYNFECFAPCGTGAGGWQGPMVSKGYMLGTLTVQ